MKILAVRFSNINSLKGGFEIDFTDPVLAGHGIFAITGPTGSGKTTILDAVSLALFGQTPRLKLSKGENELMTRGTGTCRSEVDFEALIGTRTVVFRSRWDQHRSRNSASGVLQAPRMQLTQITPRCPEDDFETSMISQVPRKVEELTGLDFERFTRTCLLAQGQFAAFLEARTDDRAQILEQITGTEIYTQISRAVFERDKAAGAAVDSLERELEGVLLLPDDEFSGLHARVQELERLRRTAEEEKRTLEGNIAWVRMSGSLRATRDGLEAQLLKHSAERESAAPDLRRLSESRRGEPARQITQRLDSIREAVGKKKSELEVSQRSVPLAKDALSTAEESQRLLREAKTGFLSTLEAEQSLIREVRSLDQHVSSLVKTRGQVGGVLQGLESSWETVRKRVEDLTTSIRESSDLSRSLQEYLDSNSRNGQLEGDLKTLKALTDRRSKAEERLGKAREEIDRRKLEADDFRKQADGLANEIVMERKASFAQASLLESVEKDILTRFSGIGRSSLEETLAMAKRRVDLGNSLHDLSLEISHGSSDRDSLEKAIFDRTALILKLQESVKELDEKKRGIEASIEELAERRTFLQTASSFDEQRAQLHEGKPCPLCGALEHPLLAHQESLGSDLKNADGAFKKEKANLRKTEEALKVAEKDLHALSGEQAGDSRSIEALAKRVLSWKDKWDVLCRGLGVHFSCEDEKALASLEEELETYLRNAVKTAADFDSLQERRIKAEKAVGVSARRVLELEKKDVQIRGSILGSENLGLEARKREEEAKGELECCEKEIRGLLLVHGLMEFDDEALSMLKKRSEEFQVSRKKLDETVRLENRKQRDLEGARSELTGLEKQKGDRMVEFEELGRRAGEAGEKRRVLFGDKDPDIRENELRVARDGHESNVAEADRQVAQAREALVRLQTTEERLIAELVALSADQEDSEIALRELLPAVGFPDETSLRSALLPQKELERLEAIEKNLETRAVFLRGQLEAVGDQIQAHEKARPTSSTLEELIKAHSEAGDRHSTAIATWQDEWKKLSTQEENRARFHSLRDRISAARQLREPWIKLNDLIGSHDGKKFREFAHGLTFSNLVSHANHQLSRFNDRYLLANEGLELQVVDRYLANSRATVKNLSGGEKFLASLALALGLARMVGRKHRMDTLFIDEGFGALDPQALEMAIAVLCGLQQQGKLIGVISHVEALKERLPARIDIQRLGGGFSSLSGPGCRTTG